MFQVDRSERVRQLMAYREEMLKVLCHAHQMNDVALGLVLVVVLPLGVWQGSIATCFFIALAFSARMFGDSFSTWAYRERIKEVDREIEGGAEAARDVWTNDVLTVMNRLLNALVALAVTALALSV